MKRTQRIASLVIRAICIAQAIWYIENITKYIS